MTTDEFNVIVDELTDKIKSTLKRKADEYNLDADRLSVFKHAAEIQHQTQAQALLGMMTKHVVSIYDYVEENKKFTRELALEKIGDNLNYLILLFAVLEEEGFKKEDKKSTDNKNKSKINNIAFEPVQLKFDDNGNIIGQDDRIIG